MPHTILYSEALYSDQSVETEVFGPDATVLTAGAASVEALPDAACAAADGLMVFRHFLRGPALARFPRLRAVVRMGVGYDRIDLSACAARGIVVCNVPDYGTTEVADHAIALALALRRGILVHHDAQRAAPPAAWTPIETPLVRRLGVQGFGIVGLGRIGTAVALRAKALGFRVVFFDPARPNGTELGLGIARARSLPALLAQADVLSLHAPLTRATRGMIGPAELAQLPRDAVVVNTARGPILDIEALHDALHAGHVAGAGLDVLPTEPPEPVPRLLAAYRARAPWLLGRLVVTPHSAFHSPQAWDDIRRKSAETIAAALAGRPQNVVVAEAP